MAERRDFAGKEEPVSNRLGQRIEIAEAHDLFAAAERIDTPGGGSPIGHPSTAAPHQAALLPSTWPRSTTRSNWPSSP
jgi:hypothetical protein